MQRKKVGQKTKSVYQTPRVGKEGPFLGSKLVDDRRPSPRTGLKTPRIKKEYVKNLKVAR